MPGVKRLKLPEEKNARLRTLPAEAMLDKEALQVAPGRKYWRQTRSGKSLSLCVMRSVCRNVLSVGLQVCPCRPAAMRLSVWQLMRIYQGASLNWHWSAGVLATAASGNRTVSASAPGCAEPDMVDGLRYGRTGQRSEDQEPELCG